MKLRQHRGGLDESLDTLVEIEPTASALLEQVVKTFPAATESDLRVLYYGYDARITWNTYLVLVGESVYGFSDEPLTV